MELVWQKSTHSQSEYCVEAAGNGQTAVVRDSKDPAGPRLEFGREEWRSLLSRVKEMA